MSTRKTTAEQIEAAKEEIRQKEIRVKQLMQRQKNEERKARNHRIARRGAHMESILPDTIGLSDGRFWTFLEKTVANDFGKRILNTLKAEQEKEDGANGTGTTEETSEMPALKSAAPKPNNGESGTMKPAQTTQNGGIVSTGGTPEAIRQGA